MDDIKTLDQVREQILKQSIIIEGNRKAIDKLEKRPIITKYNGEKAKLEENEECLFDLILQSKKLEVATCDHISYIGITKSQEGANDHYFACCRCSLTGRYYASKRLGFLTPKERKEAELMNKLYIDNFDQFGQSLISYELLSDDYAKDLYQRALAEVGFTDKQVIIAKMQRLMAQDKIKINGRQKVNESKSL